ncbi:MAG: hypothetical protein ACR2FV_07125 [Ornithinimicrobium sp.]|jgi:hypothetical protein|uniref:hypothetical protein n=1 Tax=Ornithinimicrobium sp. TaxID=1977084 RepID=UPI003D9BC6D8
MSDLTVRSMHDLGLASWFGGSLMGAVGLNGAAAQARDPQERTRLSSKGWARWAPVQAAAIGVHAIGGVGLLATNRTRVQRDPDSATNTQVKTALTIAAVGVTAYSGMQGRKVAKLQDEGSAGATEPSLGASDELQSAQKKLRALQWAIPAVTGVLLVLAAQQGEQQRQALGVLEAKRRWR